ncbi:hypothetical protein AV530_010747 [Patagioenas fasciata monilis]|uniref:Uncharacterized protein n=1 Tax=Patagioenas fasciata monilis TaxID=372326 RepID=A0A1V4K7L0_PATFA|nr:hypothetical protein AV530_010747 [Patagioenas fasciata monilis]
MTAKEALVLWPGVGQAVFSIANICYNSCSFISKQWVVSIYPSYVLAGPKQSPAAFTAGNPGLENLDLLNSSAQHCHRSGQASFCSMQIRDASNKVTGNTKAVIKEQKESLPSPTSLQQKPQNCATNPCNALTAKTSGSGCEEGGKKETVVPQTALAQDACTGISPFSCYFQWYIKIQAQPFRSG